MAALIHQRELITTFKKETLDNLRTLNKIYPLPTSLLNQLEEALEKPSQQVFTNLSHYLTCIILPKNCLPWPLDDTKSQRIYKIELAKFIESCQSSGFVSPVISSYFVNPASFRVVKLIYQLSMLAVQRCLDRNLTEESHKRLREDVRIKFVSNEKESFNIIVSQSTSVFVNRIPDFCVMRHNMEAIAKIMRDQIIENEASSATYRALIDGIVDSFLSNNFDFETREIESIKDVNKQPKFFEDWLQRIEDELHVIEESWNSNSRPLLLMSNNCFDVTSSLISRYIGKADKKSYMVEFNPEHDHIDTTNLELVSSSEQKYILKNITRDNRLIFPNLIRGFVVALCHIFKNIKINNDVFQMNEYLSSIHLNYSEALVAMKNLMDRLLLVESRLKSPMDSSDCMPDDIQFEDELYTIPPMPNIAITFEHNIQGFDSYTPLSFGRGEFFIDQHTTLNNDFKYKTPSAISLTTPFHNNLQCSFLKTAPSNQFHYDRFSSQNMSIISLPPNKINETVTGSSTGFTKQQIMRLLSTKKSSTKSKLHRERCISIKTKELFTISNGSSVLFRSHSSPNLYENREKKGRSMFREKRLATMLENSHASFLEVSGIVAIENSKESTPTTTNYVQNFTENLKLLPILTISPIETDIRTNKIDIEATRIELNSERQPLTDNNKTEVDPTFLTPKLVKTPIKKTNSLEKIINRYKKVRETATSVELKRQEKENVLEAVDFSPIWDVPDDKNYRPRESLGTVLGVDHTFLDEFDLID